jgi:hypothetical protein
MTPNGRCQVCRHPELYRIELAMAAGVAMRPLGRKFDLPRRALDRHKRLHMAPERLAQLVAGPVKLSQLAERSAEMGMTLLDYTNVVLNVLLSQLTAAGEAGDRTGTATVAGRVTEVLRLQASLTGELQRMAAPITNNVLVLGSPLMAELQTMLIETLRPYPEAAQAVVAGLERLRDRALNGAQAQVAAAQPLALPALEAER